jgi:hypothetical protein
LTKYWFTKLKAQRTKSLNYSNAFLLGSISLGGEHSFGSAALTSMKSLATDVRGGIVVPFSGYWIGGEARFSYQRACKVLQ